MDFRAERLQILAQFLEKAKSGKRPLGLSTGLNSPIPVEIAGQMGFDWVIADMEHTLMTTSQLIDVVRAAEWARLPVFVKVNQGTETEIRDAMDAGAQGIQMPKTDTIAHVRQALDAMRYVHQGGTRGMCPVARTSFYASGKYATSRGGDSDDEMAAKALLMPTIETGEAIDNIDELMTIEECPIWHIGPVDLSASLGLSESEEDQLELLKAIVWITRKIQAAGKLACRPIVPGPRNTLEDTSMSLDLIDVPYSGDTVFMAQGMWHLREANNLLKK